MLDALSYLHAKRLVHGRIKPSNVQAVGDQLKLSADHIASSTDMNASARRRDVYDPPEAGAGIVSPAGDMWSVGVTLVAALTQGVPFSGDLSQRDPVVPEKMSEPFRGIVRECLHLDPKRRCTVADVQARLQPAARSVPAGPEPVAVPEQRPKRGLVTAVVIALAVIVGIIIVYSRGKSTPPTTSTTGQSTQQASAPPAQVPTSQATPSPAPHVSQQVAQPTISQPKPSAAPPTARQSAPQPVPQQTTTTAGSSIVRQVIPEVPRSARSTITGKIRVVVRVEVDSSGKVSEATLTSPGPSRYFAGLALKAARDWEFSPVASVWMLRFYFGRAQTQVKPERVNH
jgi:TonB family protein